MATQQTISKDQELSSAPSSRLYLNLVWIFHLFLIVSSLILSMMVEFKPEHETSPLVFLAFGTCLASLAFIPTSYAAVGKLLYAKDWRFYQPLKGGYNFVLLQATSWTFFSLGLFVIGCIAYMLLTFNTIRGLWVVLGFCGSVSQIVMMVSVKHYDPASTKLVIPEATGLKKGLLKARMYFTVVVVYNLSIILAIYIIVPFLVLSFANALAFHAFSAILYFPSFLNRPELTGRREWTGLRNSFIWKDVARYFRASVICDFTPEEVQNSSQFLFALAPHGIYPITAFWLPQMPEWQKHFSHIPKPVPLGASIYHFVPFVREAALWCGSRVVSRHSFIRTLKEKRSALMIPGGIAEMKYSKSSLKEIIVISRHRGFIRLAVEQGVDIIPVFSFGETLTLDIIDIPPVSDYLLKAFTSPIPYFRGVGNWLQIPRHEKITVVIGKPIKVDRTMTKEDPKFQAYLDDLHKTFYQNLHALFEKYKEQAGHKDYKLVVQEN